MVTQRYTFSVELQPDEEAGGLAVHVPALPGCHTEGDTRDEALAMALDAVAVYIESLLSHGEPIPVETNPVGPSVSVTVTTDVKAAATAA